MIEPTELQKKAVSNVIEQKMAGRLNKKKALLDAGYSLTQSNNPKQVMESKGFKLAMSEQGLTEETFASYLAEDLKMKPQNRLGEMKLMADVLGFTKTTVDMNVNKVDESINLLKVLIDGEKTDEKVS